MVVMATRGLSGLKRLVLGNVTDSVIRSAGFPVLVVPPGVGLTRAERETLRKAEIFEALTDDDFRQVVVRLALGSAQNSTSWGPPSRRPASVTRTNVAFRCNSLMLWALQ